jgi:hypothetical protein
MHSFFQSSCIHPTTYSLTNVRSLSSRPTEMLIFPAQVAPCVLRRITENPNIDVMKGGNNEEDAGTGSLIRHLEQVMRWESVFRRQRDQP